MDRKSFLKCQRIFRAWLPVLAFQDEKSKLKITGVRLVKHGPDVRFPATLPRRLMVDQWRRGRKPHVDLSRVQGHAIVCGTRTRVSLPDSRSKSRPTKA